MGKDNLRDGRVKNWFYLENELLDREDLSIYEKMLYIVIARYVDKEDKEFPSVPTIAKKGSISERQVQMIINSLVKKGLIKKESRINKYNKSKTSNLYTLLSIKRNQSGKNNNEGVVHDMHHPDEHHAPLLVNDVHPNNTNINKNNLNNVNRSHSEEAVGNFGEWINENKAGNEEDINDIRRKINESLKGKRKCSFIKPKNSGNDKNIDKEGKYSNSSIEEKSHKSDRYRSREKELLAKEIAEELNDNHSLGAFRIIAYKIPEQRIRIFLSIIKDTYLTGKIRKNRGAMFVFYRICF